jgi:hypothetical protein
MLPHVQHQVIEDLAAALQEVIHEQIRAGHHRPSDAPSHHLTTGLHHKAARGELALA